MILVVSLLLTVFYLSLIGTYYFVWMRIPVSVTLPTTSTISYTVLIAARNEEHMIVPCLLDIIQQQATHIPLEIIVINDRSTDQTAQKVEQLIKQYPDKNIRLLFTEDIGVQGKKAAVGYGVNEAGGDYIILTDADCRRGPKWLEAIHSCISTTRAKMVYAPVLFDAKTLFEKLQTLEFSGLVAIGGAAIELNNPNMCSASNLIFERQVFFDVDGYKGSEHIASGDDEYLLHKVCKQFPKQVRFLKNSDAIVTTNANHSLAELASQRKRWVSKSTKYENIYITAILAAAYLFNAAIVYQLFANPFWGLMMLVAKALIEGVFLFNVLSFFKHKRYILLLPLAEPFHIIYVLLIGLWGNMGTYQWKDRTVR